jgi:hypothetical protein
LIGERERGVAMKVRSRRAGVIAVAAGAAVVAIGATVIATAADPVAPEVVSATPAEAGLL